MSVEEAIAAHRLDEYKDRTGDYGATKKPELSDFVSSHVPDQIVYSVTARRCGMSRWEFYKLHAKQMGRCAICGEKEGERSRNLHVDHCHDTNKVRGLICHGCNIAIGMIKDDPQTARAIAYYLEKHAIKGKRKKV